VPFLPAARLLPKEDAVALDDPDPYPAPVGAAIRVAVPRLPHIANFDDLDPLAAEADVALRVVAPGDPLPGDADLVLLPGTKATLADLAALRAIGWDVDIAAHARRGGMVVGLCGGYQMLGRRVRDPEGIEGSPAEAPGLGLLDVETVIGGAKTVRRATGIECASGAPVSGYEIHMGSTEGPHRERPWLRLDGGRAEGAAAPSGRVFGSYLHGIFTGDEFRHAFLGRLRAGRAPGAPFEDRVEAALDALAAHLERHLDLDRLLAIAAARRGADAAMPLP